MDNKYFSVEEMNTVIENLQLAFTDYSDKADTFISKCKQFQNDDSFMGEKATVVKDLVGDKEVGLVNAQKDMQAKLLAMYKHSVQSFAEKVDSAPNARLDLDTLDMVESDLKAIYEDVDTTCADIENIAKEMEAKYGHLGHITVPNANPLRESLEELCGGYNPESGSIYDLKQKFINWDEEECAYIESQLLNDEIEMANSSVIQANTTLDGVLNGSAGADDNLFDKKIYSLKNNPKLLFDDDDRSKVIKEDENADEDKDSDNNYDIFKNYKYKNNPKIALENIKGKEGLSQYIKEKRYSLVQDKFGFTDSDMDYLKNNQEMFLNNLYLMDKYCPTEADYMIKRINNENSNLKQLLMGVGWDESDLANNILLEINFTLKKYDINDKDKICMFLAECTHETGMGKGYTEVYDGSKSYKIEYRGCGAIHLTFEYGYQSFATFMILEEYPELKKYGTYINPAHNNNLELIKNQYDNIVAGAEIEGINVDKYTKIYSEGADYVGKYYTWESAGYYWKINDMNTEIENGCSIDRISEIINSNDSATNYGKRKDYYESLTLLYEQIYH